jgi:hypothetical protein
MMNSEKLFHQIALEIPGVKEGKSFGALCIKAANGKTGIMLWKNNFVVKLPVNLLVRL